MNKTTMIDKLIQVESELKLAIWTYKMNEAPLVIINEMNEAFNLILQAINILEWDEEWIKIAIIIL